MKIIKLINFQTIYIISSCLPLIGLIMLYAYFIRATLKLGHFPTPGFNDPKDLNMDIHYISISFIYLINYLNIPLWFILSEITLRKKRKIYKNFIILLTGIILNFMQMFIDPLNIVKWFLD